MSCLKGHRLACRVHLMSPLPLACTVHLMFWMLSLPGWACRYYSHNLNLNVIHFYTCYPFSIHVIRSFVALVYNFLGKLLYFVIKVSWKFLIAQKQLLNVIGFSNRYGTNIKYKIVKLVLLWSFYRKNYFRKNFISFSQKEKRAYSLHQGKGGTLVYEGFHDWMTIVDFLIFFYEQQTKKFGWTFF